MFKEYLKLSKLYYKEFKIYNLSVFFLPLMNFIASIFLLRKKIHIINYEGKKKKIILKADNYITHFRSTLFFLKEKEVRFFIDKYLDKNQIFFDIGANIGIFSLYSAIRKNAKVFAFEPEYSNLSLLKENILNTNLRDNIYPYSLAIGNDNRITNLHIADETPGAAVSSISSDKLVKTNEGFNVVWKEGVMELTMDKICEDLNIVPNMLKIDTDGNEKNVLLGAHKILKNENLKFIIMEKPSDKQNLFFCYDFLKKNHFKEADFGFSRNSFWTKK